MENTDFKFKASFSLSKLIDFWRKSLINAEECIGTEIAQRLLHDIEQIPELNVVITDLSVLEKHEKLVDALMSAIFPPAYWNSNLTSVSMPLEFTSVYSTPRFDELFTDDYKSFEGNLNYTEDYFYVGKIVTLYTGILKAAYNIDMTIVFPLIKTIIDKETGLERYFKLNLDNRFVDLKFTGPLPELKGELITMLSENMFNLELWKEVIPPSLLEFEGFLVVNAFEVTDQEALSRLKFDLLDKNILSNKGGFEKLENRIKTMFRNPELKLGITSFSNNENGLMLAQGNRFGTAFIRNKDSSGKDHGYKNSIYEKVMTSGEPQIIYDISMFPEPTLLERDVMKMGVRNILVAPLKFEGNTIGIFELGSGKAGTINAVNALKLMDVLPLFSLALKRSLEDTENRIQAIIKEKCTAIHPSVEWRFRRAAMNLIEKENSDEFAQMEEIIFRDVYPLYALSDIRNSSVIRNLAIQTDLKHNLELAKNIIHAASSHKPMPEFEHLIYKIEKRIMMLDDGLHSGDEANAISFLKKEIEPLFATLEELGPETKNAIETYNSLIDKNLGVVYESRKEYECSVRMLNECISDVVDDEEDYAQSIFPHYFEKYKTDGVEYTMYIGDSISEKERYHPMYLKNLRLWQFILMCRVAVKSEKINPLLKIPLELAHLILVQNSPLSIRFHMDQKKFDVDGTYNVHYEIMKKRIDKAEIRGKEERLTQPGKIAIVYTQQSEANEYLQYIEYLQSKGFLKKEVELMELEDLQGVYGLKALRVTVDSSSPVYDDALKSDLFIDKTKITEQSKFIEQAKKEQII